MMALKLIAAFLGIVGLVLVYLGAHVSVTSTSDGDLGEVLLYGLSGIALIVIAMLLLLGLWLYRTFFG